MYMVRKIITFLYFHQSKWNTIDNAEVILGFEFWIQESNNFTNDIINRDFQISGVNWCKKYCR